MQMLVLSITRFIQTSNQSKPIFTIMKKFALLLVLLTSSLSFAQLKKVEKTASTIETIGKAQQFGAPLEAEMTKSENTYTLRIKDSKYKQLEKYESFSFEDVDNTFNDFYATFEEGFKTMPKESVMLELPNRYVWLAFNKFLGIHTVTISFSSDKNENSQIFISNEIAKKQIDKLFGKKK